MPTIVRGVIPADEFALSDALNRLSTAEFEVERIVEQVEWRLASKVKKDGHISVADAHAGALAPEKDVALVAGDDDFDSLPVDVDAVRFRDGSA